MKIALFYHSAISDWNHGNAHFLRGVATELIHMGHDVTIYEPHDAWAVEHLIADQGHDAVDAFYQFFPQLNIARYASLDLARILDDVDLVVVHEWNKPSLVKEIGNIRASHPKLRVLFHDTHHRAVSEPAAMANYDITHYDGVLAFGSILRDLYLERAWTERAWTWHEAADTRVFQPLPESEKAIDLVWIGNWGDGERSRELREFLIEPIYTLGLKAEIFGVRYAPEAKELLKQASICYRGWTPNFRVPYHFARARVTVHVPRGPYTKQLPGIPTIRPFEAMACGIPLVCAPWNDLENLFESGRDYLCAADGNQMKKHLHAIISDLDLAAELSQNGRTRILKHHTCRHRAQELLHIFNQIRPASHTNHACITAQ